LSSTNSIKQPILSGSTKRKALVVDCIGYAAAIHYGLKFLTSNKQFEGIGACCLGLGLAIFFTFAE
jgi:hypothetical protein